MSLSANISEKAALIWAIADKLTGVYKPHEYGEVILPLTVIRRFDCILADTKDAVLEKFEQVKTLPMRDVLLRKSSGKAFYNTSKFTFERLLDDPDNIEANFRDYLNGFSENVRDILENFKFDGQITTMANKGILYIVIKEFTTPKANLHPDVISNLEMGYIFEEIIRRFSESHNEDAGQHYTPREVIQLMANILFYDDNEILSGKNVVKTIYDPACGTGGMLSVAEEYLHRLNASAELKDMVRACHAEKIEVVLVDSGSGDRTRQLMEAFRDRESGFYGIQVLDNPGRIQAAGWNVAIRNFRGDVLARIDAHSKIPEDFIARNAALLEEGEMVTGGMRPCIIQNPNPWRELLLEAEKRLRTQEGRLCTLLEAGIYSPSLYEERRRILLTQREKLSEQLSRLSAAPDNQRDEKTFTAEDALNGASPAAASAFAMSSAARAAKMSASSRELEASLFLPCTPLQHVSPTA